MGLLLSLTLCGLRLHDQSQGATEQDKAPDPSMTKTAQLSRLDFPILIRPSPKQHSSIRGICLAYTDHQHYRLQK